MKFKKTAILSAVAVMTTTFTIGMSTINDNADTASKIEEKSKVQVTAPNEPTSDTIVDMVAKDNKGTEVAALLPPVEKETSYLVTPEGPYTEGIQYNVAPNVDVPVAQPIQPVVQPDSEQKPVQNPTDKPVQPIKPAPQPEPKPEINSSLSAFENQVITLTNAERTKAGLPTFKADTKLSGVARVKSEDMLSKGYFNHQSPTYGSPFDMMSTFGISYSAAGENIAQGQRSPEAVVKAWMNSPGHRANILNGSFTHIGVGHVSGGNHWTQMFIGK